MKPFLRWAGGKSWLAKQIESFLPGSFNNYYEPFLGGGSIFIYLKSKGIITGESFLSDLNGDLINSYNVVKNHPDELVASLLQHRNESDYYYQMRDQISNNEIEQASRFIFLNRTSFNGIYRENKLGVYNVPFGNKQYNKLFDTQNLMSLSKVFKDCAFSNEDFQAKKNQITKGDFVFIDPPYTVAHGNNGFVKYNQNIFSWDDQIRLNDYLAYLNAVGAHYIMTNAWHDSIFKLFSGNGNVSVLSRYSVVGGKNAARTKYNEILVTNIN